MTLIDILKGTGTVLLNNESVKVQYNLEVYEREIVGWIRPFCGKFGDHHTLEMQDGSSIRFRFADVAGAVDAVYEIIPAPIVI